MRFGIVGNNDGPLYLLEGLKNTRFSPEFIGLQKKVGKNLQKKYRNHLKTADFYETFEEVELLDYLQNYDLDLLINCFCNFKFEGLLDQSFQVLNVHLSPLPAYRGRHPLQWALINGEEKFGITIHQMTERYDAGEIYWQKMVPVENGMSVHELRTVLMNKLQTGFAEFLQSYATGTLTPSENSNRQATFIPRRYPADSKLTEWHDTEHIYRKVNALRSEDYPAYIEAKTLNIECFKAELAQKINHDLERPFIYEFGIDQLLVACPDGQTIWLTCTADKLKYLSLGQIFE